MGLSRGQAAAMGVAVAVVAAASGVGLALGGGGAKGIVRTGPGAGAGAGAGSASGSGAASPAGAAVVPKNNIAMIYNTFGGLPDDVAMIDVVRAELKSEGYEVKVFQDNLEGLDGLGNVTLANFISMAKAGVILIDSHGLSGTGTQSQKACPGEKGLVRLPPDGSAPAPCSAAGTALAPPTASPAPARDPAVLVEWYNTRQELYAANKRYVLVNHYDPSWFDVAIGARSDHQQGFALLLTASGIAHFFAHSQIAVLDALACHSAELASSFHARSYFGYSDVACYQTGDPDTKTLFNRLTGVEGLDARTTVAAAAKGGFQDADFHLAPGAQPVVLSPAVESVSPPDGTGVGEGTSTTVTVHFDAAMDPSHPNDFVDAVGCNAKIANAHWADPSTLSLRLTVPTHPPPGDITLTAPKRRAVAQGGFPNDWLDGNQDPAGQPGLAPNDDDYVWHLPCSSGSSYPVKIEYTGTFTDDYNNLRTNSIYHSGPFAFHVNYRWDETRIVTVQFPSGAPFSAAPGTGTFTASGSGTSSGTQGGPNDDCTWAPATSNPVWIIVNQATSQAVARSIAVQAPMPISADQNGTAQQLTHSGTCSNDTIGGPAPYLFHHPEPGAYDPGGQLQAAYAGSVNNVDLDQLRTKPMIVKFPVSYTTTDQSGGTDHVVVDATLTISLA